jgi:uncharacterized protein (UPF0332 family)
MTVQHKKQLTQNWLQKADESYTDALELYKCRRYGGSVTRLYYAVYDLLRALFAVDNIISKDGDTIKRHSTLHGRFNKIYVNEKKIFPSEFFAYIKKVEMLRVDVDYGDMVTKTQNEVQPHIEYFDFYSRELLKYINEKLSE